MKFTVKGVPGQPVALLIHPVMADASFFDDLIDEMRGSYRVALPTLDGHYAGSPSFASARQEAEVLARKLQAEGVERVRVLLGCSLGAAVALELLAMMPRGFARLAVFDSPALIDSGLSRAIMAHDLRKIRKVAKEKPERARRLIDTRDDDYAFLIQHNAAAATDATVEGVCDACCHAALPQVPEAQQPFMTFVWGSFDPAMKCRARVTRAYPHANVVIKDRYAHCDYLMMHPEDFAREFMF